jgi:ABC-type glycerol-3-phosphate transport system substrate-binding protein
MTTTASLGWIEGTDPVVSAGERQVNLLRAMPRKEEVMNALRKLGMLVVALVLSVAVSSPAGAGQKKYEGVTLKIMLPDGFTESKPVYDILVEAGKVLGTEVKVSWYSMDELHDKALMDFTAGNKAWDILLVHSPSRGQWADMGVIEPLGK